MVMLVFGVKIGVDVIHEDLKSRSVHLVYIRVDILINKVIDLVEILYYFPFYMCKILIFFPLFFPFSFLSFRFFFLIEILGVCLLQTLTRPYSSTRENLGI